MLSLASSHPHRLSLRRGLGAAAAFAALAWGLPAGAQVTNFSVTVNGVASAAGTFNSANIFQSTCEGTQTTTNTSGDPAIFRLQWTVQSDDTIFWDTAADCNTGNTVTDDAGAVISGNDNTGGITIEPPGADSAQGYGVGAGNVEIDMRTVFASAFPKIYGNVFDGGNPCVPPEQGTLYVCVTQEEIGTSLVAGQTQTTLSWYMAVTYDTFTPEAPSGITGQSGDSNVIVGWSFSDTNFPEQDINFNVYYRPDQDGLVPDLNGVCGPATVTTDAGPAESGRSIWQTWATDGGGDGGCPLSDQDTFGDCCGDAGVTDGTCNPADAGPGINTPGVCGGCFVDGDCGGNNACVHDDFGNNYCGASCSTSHDLDGGGNLDCPIGFQCVEQTDVAGQLQSFVCSPSPNLCIPAWIACGACGSNADCPTGECVDAGATYCAVFCGSEVNADGDGGCLGATSCLSVTDNGVANNLCALPSFACYDPTLLAVALDGGDQFVTDAGPTEVDAGAGGSGIDTTGWQVQQFSGTLSTGQIGGLTNGTCYDFVVETVVDDGTMGDNSTEVVVAPVKNYDFWRLYQMNGGGDTGGLHCQAGGGGIGVLGVLAALIGWRRRRPSEPRR